jgi:hypothetical protein
VKRRLVGGTLALAVAAIVAWLCWPSRLPSFDWRLQVPADADAWLWLDQPDEARRGLTALTRSVPGLRGLPEALQLWTGVDLLDADAVAEAGLRDDVGPVGFAWRGSTWLVVPVRNGDGERHLQDLAAARGWRLTATGPHTARLQTAAQADAGECWLTPDQRWVLRLGQPLADAERAWQQAAKLGDQRSTEVRPGALHLHLGIATEQREQLRKRLGPAAGLVGGVLDRLRTAELDLAFAGASPTLRVRLAGEPGQLADVAHYYQDFVPEGGGLLELGDVLPDETGLLVRGRLNPLMLQLALNLVGGPGALTTGLTNWHPALAGIDPARQVLAPWDGQWGVALLSVGDGLPLDPATWTPATIRSQFRLVLAGHFKTDQAAAELVARVRSAVDTAGQATASTQVGPWSGWTLAEPNAPWSLLQQARRVMLVSGPGAIEDLQRVASGKFASLKTTSRGDPERELVAGRRQWWGVLATTPRLVRALRRRGVPDYAVDLLAAVGQLAVVARWSADALEFTTHLQPTGAP